MTHIHYLNASKSAISTEDQGLLDTLHEELKIIDYTHKPSRFSKWDGTKRLFNRKTCEFPTGYLHEVLSICRDYGAYTVDQELKQRVREVTREEIKAWCDGINITGSDGSRIYPFDYQIEALYLFVKYSSILGKAATNAGKSLIFYLCVRFWYDLLQKEANILLVVPNIMLTKQMRDDFLMFSSNDKTVDIEQFVHVAGDGVSPYTHKKMIISTWQTLKNQNDDFFKRFNCLLFDEVHGASAECCSRICEVTVNSDQRLGLTGTFTNIDHERYVKQFFGTVQVIVTTKETQERGISSKTKIVAINLQYSLEDKKKVHSMSYEEEMEFLMNHSARNEVIQRLASGLGGNSLFLFQRVDDHLEVLAEKCRELGLDVLVIHSGVDSKIREEHKARLERETDLVLFATYGTLSTGLSIKNLNNLIFCYPTKSVIRVIQSVGRMLRLHKDKDVAKIYDIFDNLMYMDRKNYSYLHGLDRLGFYKMEGHPISLTTKSL